MTSPNKLTIHSPLATSVRPARAAGRHGLEALEGRVALRLTAHLTHSSEALPHNVTERLRVAREHALSAARQKRHQHSPAAAQAIHVTGDRQAALSGPPSWWLRVASALPLMVLLAGLVLIQQHADREQIVAAAEIDSALLSDELPPEAYQDAGFSDFLSVYNSH